MEQTRARSLVFQLLCHEANCSQRTQGCGLDDQSIQFTRMVITRSFGTKLLSIGQTADLLPKYLDPELYKVINGAVPETTKVSHRRLVRCKEANCHCCRFWNSNGIIVRDELSPAAECALILYKSSVHRGLPCRLYRAYCRSQNVEPGYN